MIRERPRQIHDDQNSLSVLTRVLENDEDLCSDRAESPLIFGTAPDVA